MSLRLIGPAEQELEDAVAYFEARSHGLGLEFNAEFRRTVGLIEEYSHLWPLHGDGTRRALMKRFPYQIVYLEQGANIWIIALAHCKRVPGYWHRRIGDAS